MTSFGTTLKIFYEEHKNDEREYFLGSIVTCDDTDENNRINIIDGQQRITSFLLLLRAFYYKLEGQLQNDPSDEEVAGLMKSIEPCIWKINPMTKKISNKKETHIKTLVATDDDKIDFELILEQGLPRTNSTSYYSRNYSLFSKLFVMNMQKNHFNWMERILFIYFRTLYNSTHRMF